jgi:putative intracellular protease/amidase
MTKMLIVLTGARSWTLKDGSDHPTGFWAEEFLAPYRIFAEAGLDITVATPGGVTPVADDNSLSAEMNDGDEDKVAELRRQLDDLSDTLANTAVLEDVDPADFDAVFVPGGHGPMEDLAVSKPMGELLTTMLGDESKVVASVCHGPASFLAATAADGGPLFAGRQITAFTNEEETQAGLAEQAPWLLEDRLRQTGATITTGAAWAPHVVVDGNLVTGQNPASSEEVATSVLALLGAGAR